MMKKWVGFEHLTSGVAETNQTSEPGQQRTRTHLKDKITDPLKTSNQAIKYEEDTAWH